MLWASQVAPGNENGLRLRVYGSQGRPRMAAGRAEPPALVAVRPAARRSSRRGTGAANADAARVTRIPSGHPEGYLEGFATIYSEIAQAIRAARSGGKPADPAAQFPTIDDGIAGVAFIEAAVASSAAGGTWVAPR